MTHPEDQNSAPDKPRFEYDRTFKHEFEKRKRLIIDCRDEAFANHFSRPQLVATVAGLVDLDLNWHLESFPLILDEISIDLLNLVFGNELSEDYKATIPDKIEALQKLANELRWIANYGCRLYM